MSHGTSSLTELDGTLYTQRLMIRTLISSFWIIIGLLMIALRTRMFSFLCALSLVTIASGFHISNAATFRKGDVFTTGSDQLYHYRPNGTLVQSFDPTGYILEGATITKDGKLITTRRAPVSGISIFDADGNEFTFDTSAVSLPADVSVFSDGTLAINDQGDNDVDLYSPSGVYLRSISHALLSWNSVPFGSAIGPDDTLWLAMHNKGVTRFSKDGTLLGYFVPSLSVQEIAIDPVDGTLWTSSPDGELHHLSTDGSELSSFMTAATPPFLSGIAVAADQSLYVTSQFSTSMYHYTPNGDLLDEFELAGAGPLFISVAIVPEPTSWLLLMSGVLSMIIRTRKNCRNR